MKRVTNQHPSSSRRDARGHGSVTVGLKSVQGMFVVWKLRQSLPPLLGTELQPQPLGGAREGAEGPREGLRWTWAACGPPCTPESQGCQGSHSSSCDSTALAEGVPTDAWRLGMESRWPGRPGGKWREGGRPGLGTERGWDPGEGSRDG